MGRRRARQQAALTREALKRGDAPFRDDADPRDPEYTPNESEDGVSAPAGKRTLRRQMAQPAHESSDTDSCLSDDSSSDEGDEDDEVEELDSTAWRSATRGRYPAIILSMKQSTLTGKRAPEESQEQRPRKQRELDPMARSKVYSGASATTQWRNRDRTAKHDAHAKKFCKIDSFFVKKSQPVPLPPHTEPMAVDNTEDVVLLSSEEFYSSLNSSTSAKVLAVPPVFSSPPTSPTATSSPDLRTASPSPDDELLDGLALDFERLSLQVSASVGDILASFQQMSVSDSLNHLPRHPLPEAAAPGSPVPEGPRDATQFERMACRLRTAMAQAKKEKNVDVALELRLLSEYNILRERYRQDNRNDPSGAAALQVASTQPGYNRTGESSTRGVSFARTVQRRAAYFLEHGSLPPSTQGKGAVHKSLLDLPGMDERIDDFIAGLGVGKINPRRLQRQVNEVILPELSPGETISEKTARKWLKQKGYCREAHKKGVYVDGHERSDNVVYRQGLYLPNIQVHENLSVKYDDKTGEAVPPKLAAGEKRRHLVFHDECYFNAKDREKMIWLKDGEQQLRQKGRGRGIHVSGFIYEHGGFLRLDEAARAKHDALPPTQRLKTTDSMVIIYPGKNNDGWWDVKQLSAQIIDTLNIFEYLHPDDQAVLVFDQSTAHAAFADDALVASRMQVGSGPNQPKMHSTFIPNDNPDPQLRNKPQSMVLPDGRPKGMEIVLKERGLYSRIRTGRLGKPVGKCKSCSATETKRTELEKRAREALESDPELYGSLGNAMTVLSNGSEVPIPDSGDELCCMQKCLSVQSDFLAEKPKIQLYIEGRGHFCLFLPKFHCELNPIEMVWSNAKQRFRAEADGTFPTAKALVPKCLDAVSVTAIRHYYRRVYRYMDAYRKGLDAKQAAHAVKKYRSHRSVPEAVMKDFDSYSD